MGAAAQLQPGGSGLGPAAVSLAAVVAALTALLVLARLVGQMFVSRTEFTALAERIERMERKLDSLIEKLVVRRSEMDGVGTRLDRIEAHLGIKEDPDA